MPDKIAVEKNTRGAQMHKSIPTIMLVLFLLTGCSSTSSPAGRAVSEGKVDLDLYVMSQCPYGIQVENALEPVLKDLGSAVNLDVQFIGAGSADDLRSMHGEGEIFGDIAQLCAKKYSPDNYFDFILCQNKDSLGIPGSWENCAEKTNSGVEKIRTCFEGDEGKQLAAESFAKSASMEVQGSPTIFINDKQYSGRRDSAGLRNALCKNIQGTKPEACNAIPESKPIGITVINDKRCDNCDTAAIERALENVFFDAKVKYVDVSSAEGSTLVKTYQITVLPAYLLSAEVEKADAWSDPNLKAAFEKVGGVYRLRDAASGATYYINEKARADHEASIRAAKQKVLDTIGVTLDDNKPQVDFFVMSYCPYGNQAEEALKQVYDALKDKAAFNPHYVIYENYRGGSDAFCTDKGKYCSMHGIQELHQNVRELCVNRYYGISKWFDFAIAMNAKCGPDNADTCWQDVAQTTGIEKTKIEACEMTEGKDMMASEKALNGMLGVSGSPQIFIDGEPYGGERSSTGFWQGLCRQFTNAPSECTGVTMRTMEETTTPMQGRGCGG
ncbi:GILT family protein [Candidatus Woesearchaeota archaeon]|nr:GILT family protein [Candidatus Woesearchaeota archaeon]